MFVPIGKKSLMIVILALAVTVANGSASSRAVRGNSPSQLVADLYKVHQRHHGPFYQTHSRSLLDRYFDRRLSTLIWRDRVRSKGEVGALDFDPLLNTQEDAPITNFRVHPAVYHQGRATVNVTFKRFGGTQTISYRLYQDRNRWKIDDIIYGNGTSLVGVLKHG